MDNKRQVYILLYIIYSYHIDNMLNFNLIK